MTDYQMTRTMTKQEVRFFEILRDLVKHIDASHDLHAVFTIKDSEPFKAAKARIHDTLAAYEDTTTP